MKYQAVQHAQARGIGRSSQRLALALLGLWLACVSSACGGAVLEPDFTATGSPSTEDDAGGSSGRTDAAVGRRDAGSTSSNAARDAGPTSDGGRTASTGALDHELLGAYCGNS